MLKFNDEENHLKHKKQTVKVSYKIPKGLNGGVAVDVGANVGAFTLVNFKRFDRIICIEPSQDSVNNMKMNFEKNNINNAEVYRYAVSDKDNKILKLYSHKFKNYSGNATTIKSNDNYDYDVYEEVESISLEGIFKKFKLGKIDYLKVDCEFSEVPFLMDKDLSYIDYIGIEHHGMDQDQTKKLINHILKYFKKRGNLNSEMLYVNKFLD